MKLRRNKNEERAGKLLLKELPYFNFRGCLAQCHGQFNSSISDTIQTRRNLDKLTSLYDLGIFNLNTDLDVNLSTDCNLPNQRIQSRYFSPHSFNMFKKNLPKEKVDSTFSVFSSNVASINRNLENVLILLDELDFHFNVIGITETKITNSNENNFHPSIPGYVFEYVPTPLASGGVGLFVDQSLHYTVLEKTSNEAFQAIWIEISFVNHKNIVCGIIYRQHNSPDYFQSYFEVVSYAAVLCLVTQRSSPRTAAENRTTFLSLCFFGLSNKPITNHFTKIASLFAGKTACFSVC